MNERHWADRFSYDVDDLLCETRPPDFESLPIEYRQALELTHTLAATGFSTRSKIRDALRHRLLNGRIGERERWHRRAYTMHRVFWRRRPWVTLAACGLVILVIVMLIWPDALTAVAQGLQELILGDHTVVHQHDPDATYLPASQTLIAGVTPTVEKDIKIVLEHDFWAILTSIGGFGGNISPGYNATIQRFGTIEEAQAASASTLRRPDYLPPGYALHEVIIAPYHNVLYFYDGPGSEVVIAFTPGGGSKSTSGSIERVELNGRPAAWISGHSLYWEEYGYAITVGGLDLSLDEAIRIAQSLEWVRSGPK